MFKTDKESLEKLSFNFNEQDISRISKLLELLQQSNLGTLPSEEITRLQAGLAEIGRLKLEGKVYAFHVDDSYARRQGGDAGEGVELYIRRGDTLKEFRVCPDRDWVLKVDQTTTQLEKAKVNTIYTGPITDEGFLGLHKKIDPEDPIFRSPLGDSEIGDYEEAGINVVVLDKLI